MKTLIIAETRKVGVEWLENNVASNPQERRRTQTEIEYRNGDSMVVVSKADQVRGRPMTVGDRAIVVGTVEESVVNTIVNMYLLNNIQLLVEQQGTVMSATDLKRRALMLQMEDLEREDRLRNYFQGLNLEGIRIGKTDIRVDNRQFTISITGNFV